MKKLIKSGLLSVTLLATIVVNASEKLDIKVTPNTLKMLSVSLTEVTSGEVIKIKDHEGAVLFSEVLKETANYSKVFSLSELPEGLYFIESNEASRIHIKPILVKENSVTMLANSEETYLAPEITIKGNSMSVLIHNNGNAPVSINVYDKLGTLLAESEENNNTLVYKNFNAREFLSKKIIISVSEGDYSFVKEIQL